MQSEFVLTLGFGAGRTLDWGSWENQHGRGVFLNFSLWFFSFEFTTVRVNGSQG